VVISTTNHYFVAQDYREGPPAQFKVGQTGTIFNGGTEWMTMNQIEAFGGGNLRVGYASARKGGSAAPVDGGSTGGSSGSADVPAAGLSYDNGASYQAGVEQLQKALVSAGYLSQADFQSGPGHYGNKTRAAVAQLQKDAGISDPDGSTYGPKTRAALIDKLAGAAASSEPTAAAADAEINDKLNPARNRMDPALARQLSQLTPSQTFLGGSPEGSPAPVYFKSFTLDPNGDVNNPDAQVYTYPRDDGTGNKQWATFEVAGSFSKAYATIDDGKAGTNSALGLPVSGRERMTEGEYAGKFFQNFENGKLIETEPGSATGPAKFTWLDNDGGVVKEGFETPFVDLEKAQSSAAVRGIAPSGNAFIDSIAAGAVASQRKYGIPASVTMAQAILESSWGKSGLSKDVHNLFGIKGEGPAGSKSYSTREVDANGREYFVDAKFRAYHDEAESIDDHARVIVESGYYGKALAVKGNANAFADALTGVYATDPKYGALLKQIMKENNLYQYDNL
jgi:flagellum-specific peptidoglycan hydrolase FlgJ